MVTIKLTREQKAIGQGKAGPTVFLSGPAGTGKTTAGVERLRHLLGQGVDPGRILVMVPQRTLAQPYYAVANSARTGQANVLTLGGVARRAVDLFWPLIASEMGFANPEQRPTFLSLETAQYFMAQVAGPLIDAEQYFDSVRIDRGRLYSQIIDNLNKAAVIPGLEYTRIADRLKAAWVGDRDQLRMYDDVQVCADAFRAYCLQHNLLDFSLQVETFDRLRTLPEVQRWLRGQAQHVICENVEEDTPVAHNLMAALITSAESALVIYDEEAGFRQFLGADEAHALKLRDLCDTHTRFESSHVLRPPLARFAIELAQSLDRQPQPDLIALGAEADPLDGLTGLYQNFRYHPEVLNDAAEAIISLVHQEGVPPGEIVVIAPFMSDALRFSLMNRLAAGDVPVRSHRPSRPLREEPAARALLILARLAHPDWRSAPAAFDVATMLMQAINGLDLVRAQLLAGAVYRQQDNRPSLLPFDRVRPQFQERITFVFGERYQRLFDWLQAIIAAEPLDLDHFFSRAFGEVLSQPGFGFHEADQPEKDAARVAADLIDSARKFRQIIDAAAVPVAVDATPALNPAQEYVRMMGEGIVADLYIERWDAPADEAVLVAPAYTFLMRNRPVRYQFWLNVGASGWAQRLYQPLTNPYVLELNWPEGARWTDEDEYAIARDILYRLTQGLIRRCRDGIYMGFSELGEQGIEQRGELLRLVQGMLRRRAGGAA
ncbi:MAG: hypothetical protein ACOCYT_02460 [Chloroflexota bacterium]